MINYGRHRLLHIDSFCEALTMRMMRYMKLTVTTGRFSNECRKAKTKVIALTNHNRNKKQNGPIRN